jgi:hypothetical protein
MRSTQSRLPLRSSSLCSWTTALTSGCVSDARRTSAGSGWTRRTTRRGSAVILTLQHSWLLPRQQTFGTPDHDEASDDDCTPKGYQIPAEGPVR